MSIFNKIRTFPEYHDAYDAVIENRQTEEKIIENMVKAFGADFDNFYKKQPEDLHPGLQNIKQGGENEGKIMTDLHSKLAFLPQDFHTYLDSFNERKRKHEETNEIESAACKAEEKAKATELKLQQLRTKNSPEVAKTEALAVQLRSQATSAREKADKAKHDFEEYCKEYQTQVANTFITMMEGFFSLRQKSVKQLAAAGAELENAVQQLHEFNDPNIAVLQNKLKQYEETQI